MCRRFKQVNPNCISHYALLVFFWLPHCGGGVQAAIAVVRLSNHCSGTFVLVFITWKFLCFLFSINVIWRIALFCKLSCFWICVYDKYTWFCYTCWRDLLVSYSLSALYSFLDVLPALHYNFHIICFIQAQKPLWALMLWKRAAATHHMKCLHRFHIFGAMFPAIHLFFFWNESYIKINKKILFITCKCLCFLFSINAIWWIALFS